MNEAEQCTRHAYEKLNAMQSGSEHAPRLFPDKNPLKDQPTTRDAIGTVIVSLHTWMIINHVGYDRTYQDFFINFGLFMHAKNIRYGNSALTPLQIFLQDARDSEPSIGILARIDDKLARIRSARVLRKNDVVDLLGYLVLLFVAREWWNVNPRGVRQEVGIIEVFSHEKLHDPAVPKEIVMRIDAVLEEIAYMGPMMYLLSELMIDLVILCVKMQWIDLAELVD